MAWPERGHGGALCIPAVAAGRHSHGKAFCISAGGNLPASTEEYTCPLMSHCAGLVGSSLVFFASGEGSRSGQPSPAATEPQVPQPCLAAMGALALVQHCHICRHRGGTSAVPLPLALQKRWRLLKPVGCQHSTAYTAHLTPIP